MSHRLLFLSAVAFAWALSSHAFAQDETISNSGSIGSDIFGFTYKITGMDLSKMERLDDRYFDFYGEATAPVITLSGEMHLVVSQNYVKEYEAVVMASTKHEDANGNFFGSRDFVTEGPSFQKSGTVDGRGLESGERFTETIPFNLSVPVPAYNRETKTTHVELLIKFSRSVTDYRWTLTGGEPSYQGGSACRLKGSARIPEDMVVEAAPVLSISNGGKLDPLRIKLRLMDNSVQPPKPLANKVIRVAAPIPRYPADELDEHFENADWSLSGYFMSKTKCPNCKTVRAGGDLITEVYYYLENPAQPIQVLTDEEGRAELQFLLDLPALGMNIPRRDSPLLVPIQAKYIGDEQDGKGRSQAEASLEVSMAHLGYIESVNYIKPQEWEPWGGLGDYRTTPQDMAEYPLGTYYDDQGTGLPYDEVKGADRAVITPSNQVVAPQSSNPFEISGGSLELQPPALAEQLKPGMLFAYGDLIDLDARGLQRLKPVANTDPAYGTTGRPGWIWIKLKFFDGLRGKVGVSGNLGQHSITIGRTTEEIGWMPTGKAFAYWAAQEAAEYVVFKFVPVLGQVDFVSDMAGYINWANNATPHYIRVQSAFVTHIEDDGSVSLIVKEGSPALVTQATGFSGLGVDVGQAAVIGPDNEVSVSRATTEQRDYANGLLGRLQEGTSGSPGLAPIELDMVPPPDQQTGGLVGVDADGTVDIEPDDPWQLDDPSLEEDAGDVVVLERSNDGRDIAHPSGVIPGGVSYWFDEFIIETEGEWILEPESEDAFATLTNREMGLAVMVVRTEVDSAMFLEMIGDQPGDSLPMKAAGRNARLFALYDGDDQSGSMLSFDDPMAGGLLLHVVFITAAQYWPETVDYVSEMIANMRFVE